MLQKIGIYAATGVGSRCPMSGCLFISLRYTVKGLRQMERTLAPQGKGILDSTADDAKRRHEAFVDLFGQYLFWLRGWANASCRKLIESHESRQKLGSILGSPYEAIARQPKDDQEKAIALASSSVDSFIRLLLGVLAHCGSDFPLDDDHVVRFRLTMEVVDGSSDSVVHEETINRGGEKHFADYWGRWLNRTDKARTP